MWRRMKQKLHTCDLLVRVRFFQAAEQDSAVQEGFWVL